MTTTAERMTVRQLVEVELAAAPADEPRAIADRVAAALPDDQLRVALVECIPLIVKQVLARQVATLAGLGRGRQSRGEAEAEAAPLELLTRSFSVTPGNWKELRNCRAKDLERMAKYRGYLARTNSRWQQRFEHLADALHQAGERLVRDLDPAAVEAVFRHEPRGPD